MSGILFSVFSGQASAIFDDFLFDINEKYVRNKNGEKNYHPSVYIIETQWDNGGHTGYLQDFNTWLDDQDKFLEIFGGNFKIPPPMGDLKSQISRWSRHLIKKDFGNTISSLIENRYDHIDDTIHELEVLINTLKRIQPDIFILEERINFFEIYSQLYKDFSLITSLMIKHSVGNLFLNFLYYYSFLLVDSVETIYLHHHEAFFNFLKDLSLIPRGIRIEFLIDGRYNLSGTSHDNVKILSEKFFDEYPSNLPVLLESYSLKSIEGNDFENKFNKLLENSDLVVIPPGSLSNWMPIINKFYSELKSKTIIWFVNAFTHYSEESLENQIKYLHSLGLNPIIVAPKLNNAFDELNEDEREIFERSYLAQGKKSIDFNNEFKNFKNLKVLRAIPLKELEPGDGGIKYSPHFVNFFLTNLSEKINYRFNDEFILQIALEMIEEYKVKI